MGLQHVVPVPALLRRLFASLTLHNGDLYSTTKAGGTYLYGSVFELTPNSNGWSEVTLHSFQGGNGSDGSNPVGSVLVDSSGNLYGTAMNTGEYSSGTAWEIAQ